MDFLASMDDRATTNAVSSESGMVPTPKSACSSMMMDTGDDCYGLSSASKLFTGRSSSSRRTSFSKQKRVTTTPRAVFGDISNGRDIAASQMNTVMGLQKNLPLSSGSGSKRARKKSGRSEFSKLSRRKSMTFDGLKEIFNAQKEVAHLREVTSPAVKLSPPFCVHKVDAASREESNNRKKTKSRRRSMTFDHIKELVEEQRSAEKSIPATPKAKPLCKTSKVTPIRDSISPAWHARIRAFSKSSIDRSAASAIRDEACVKELMYELPSDLDSDFGRFQESAALNPASNLYTLTKEQKKRYGPLVMPYLKTEKAKKENAAREFREKVGVKVGSKTNGKLQYTDISTGNDLSPGSFKRRYYESIILPRQKKSSSKVTPERLFFKAATAAETKSSPPTATTKADQCAQTVMPASQSKCVATERVLSESISTMTAPAAITCAASIQTETVCDTLPPLPDEAAEEHEHRAAFGDSRDSSIEKLRKQYDRAVLAEELKMNARFDEALNAFLAAKAKLKAELRQNEARAAKSF